MWDSLLVETTSYGNSDCIVEFGTSNLVWLHISFARTGFRTNPEHPVGDFELAKIAATAAIVADAFWSSRSRAKGRVREGQVAWASRSRVPRRVREGHCLCSLRSRDTFAIAKVWLSLLHVRNRPPRSRRSPSLCSAIAGYCSPRSRRVNWSSL